MPPVRAFATTTATGNLGDFVCVFQRTPARCDPTPRVRALRLQSLLETSGPFFFMRASGPFGSCFPTYLFLLQLIPADSAHPTGLPNLYSSNLLWVSTLKAPASRPNIRPWLISCELSGRARHPHPQACLPFESLRSGFLGRSILDSAWRRRFGSGTPVPSGRISGHPVGTDETGSGKIFVLNF